jgi:hypothetical protein
MNREEDEKLWDLLGRSAEPKASPFFARNVVRKIREAKGESPGRPWWNLRWLVPSAGVAVAVIAALLLRLQVPEARHSNPRGDGLTASEAQDSDLMADLDDLVASEDSGIWDDETVLL